MKRNVKRRRVRISVRWCSRCQSVKRKSLTTPDQLVFYISSPIFTPTPTLTRHPSKRDIAAGAACLEFCKDQSYTANQFTESTSQEQRQEIVNLNVNFARHGAYSLKEEKVGRVRVKATKNFFLHFTIQIRPANKKCCIYAYSKIRRRIRKIALMYFLLSITFISFQ